MLKSFFKKEEINLESKKNSYSISSECDSHSKFTDTNVIISCSSQFGQVTGKGEIRKTGELICIGASSSQTGEVAKVSSHLTFCFCVFPIPREV